MRETRLTRACISCKQAKGRGRPVSSLQVTALRVPSASCPRATKSLACTAVAHKRQKHTAHKRLKHTHVLPDSIPHGTQHTHTYTHTYIHTYTCIHTCVYTHINHPHVPRNLLPQGTLSPLNVIATRFMIGVRKHGRRRTLSSKHSTLTSLSLSSTEGSGVDSRAWRCISML